MAYNYMNRNNMNNMYGNNKKPNIHDQTSDYSEDNINLGYDMSGSLTSENNDYDIIASNKYSMGKNPYQQSKFQPQQKMGLNQYDVNNPSCNNSFF